MDDEPSLVLALEHLRNDLVEGHHFRFHSRSKKLQREISSRKRARNRNAFLLDFTLRERARRNDHRPIALAHAAAARHQRVQILNIRIGVKRNRGHIVDAFARLLVQRLDIAKRVREAQSRHANLAGGQAVEHEGIVGIRAVSDADLAHL